MSRRHILSLLSVLLAMLVMAGGSAAPRGEIVIVLSRDSEPHREVVTAMRTELARQNRADLPLRVLTLDDLASQFEQLLKQKPALIVTVGNQAAQELAARRPPVPVLHTLIPRQAWEALPRSAAMRDSAIYLDQPLVRQLQLIKLALPGRARIGAITGPATRKTGDELKVVARRLGLRAQVESIDQPAALLPALNQVVDDIHVLVSVPDPMVFAPNTIHHILLTTYRYRVPVLGLSRSYVDAGALLAVYSSPEDIGRQLGEIVSRLGNDRVVLPAPQYPKYYAVSVNSRVAASLGLRLEAESVLLQKLQATERQH